MNQKFEQLIISCNNCILMCEEVIKNCHNCTDECPSSGSVDLPDTCANNCQKIVDVCYKCIHECNLILENRLHETDRQEETLKNCLKACHDCIRRCQDTINKILDLDIKSGCAWAIDVLNNCISACDECIEAFEK